MDWNFAVTAMGILPHKDEERALSLSLTMDIPFFPQLPNLSFYEDMYVQVSSNFPGIYLDLEKRKILFSREKFYQDLEVYVENMENREFFALRKPYSTVYEDFLSKDLKDYMAIRGQVTGPVSFGFRIADEDGKPIIYHDDVREIIFDFIAKKYNVMLEELKEKNQGAFVWIDEPGLGWIFSGMSGYTDVHAKEDYQRFFSQVEGIKGLHLCAEVDVGYLLGLGIDLLSFDAHHLGFLSDDVAKAMAEFMESGGVIAWGIAPTDPTKYEDVDENLKRIRGYFEKLRALGIGEERIRSNSLLAPARCLVKAEVETDLSEEEMVEKVMENLKELRKRLLDFL